MVGMPEASDVFSRDPEVVERVVAHGDARVVLWIAAAAMICVAWAPDLVQAARRRRY